MALENQGVLNGYWLLYAIKSELYRDMSMLEEARDALNIALRFTQNKVEIRHLQRKLAELGDA